MNGLSLAIMSLLFVAIWLDCEGAFPDMSRKTKQAAMTFGIFSFTVATIVAVWR